MLNKYTNKQNYESLDNGIYQDFKNKRYVITLNFELEENEDSQYPLEDILEKYFVNTTSHLVVEGRHLEVEIEDSNDQNFESLDVIKEVASLVGKQVYNKEEDGYIKLVIE